MSFASARMLGDGGIHGSPVSGNNIARFQPFIGTTVSSAPIRSSALNSCANSPMVNPCRNGISLPPTKLRNLLLSMGPSTTSPPSGFGRSSTTTRTTVVCTGTQAFEHRPDERINASAYVLQVDDQTIDVGEEVVCGTSSVRIQAVDSADPAAHIGCRLIRSCLPAAHPRTHVAGKAELAADRETDRPEDRRSSEIRRGSRPDSSGARVERPAVQVAAMRGSFLQPRLNAICHGASLVQ